jgi:hypothetical protein
MVESPVPYLIGILGNWEMNVKFMNNSNISSNLVYFNKNGTIEFIVSYKKNLLFIGKRKIKLHPTKSMQLKTNTYE